MAGKSFSFLNRDEATSANALRFAEMLGTEKTINDENVDALLQKYFPDKGTSAEQKRAGEANRKNLKNIWTNANRAIGSDCKNITDPNGGDHYWVDTVPTPKWHDPTKVVKTLPTGKSNKTYFLKKGGDVRIPKGYKAEEKK